MHVQKTFSTPTLTLKVRTPSCIRRQHLSVHLLLFSTPAHLPRSAQCYDCAEWSLSTLCTPGSLYNDFSICSGRIAVYLAQIGAVCNIQSDRSAPHTLRGAKQSMQRQQWHYGPTCLSPLTSGMSLKRAMTTENNSMKLMAKISGRVSVRDGDPNACFM